MATLLLPIGIFAFWTYYKAGHVDLKLALLIAAGFAVGGWFGGLWAQHLPDAVLRRGFAAFFSAGDQARHRALRFGFRRQVT